MKTFLICLSLVLAGCATRPGASLQLDFYMPADPVAVAVIQVPDCRYVTLSKREGAMRAPECALR